MLCAAITPLRFHSMCHASPCRSKALFLHFLCNALALCLPLVLLPLFQASVASEESFASITTWLSNPLCKLVVLALIWGYLHHFCAGIRYLLLDLHLGIDKVSAAKSAGAVFGVSLALTLVFGLKLFGVW